MIREFPEQKKAVVLDGQNKVLFQLSENADALTFKTKHEAELVCKKMGFSLNKVERIEKRFETVYQIRYDFRYPYYIALWEC